MKKWWKTILAIAIGLVILFYDEILIYGPIIVFGPIIGGSLLCLGMFSLACLVCYYTQEDSQRFRNFIQKIDTKSAKFIPWLKKMSFTLGFFAITFTGGALVLSYINKKYLGINGSRLYCFAFLSSLAFSIIWSGIYAGVWAKLLRQHYIVR